MSLLVTWSFTGVTVSRRPSSTRWPHIPLQTEIPSGPIKCLTWNSCCWSANVCKQRLEVMWMILQVHVAPSRRKLEQKFYWQHHTSDAMNEFHAGYECILIFLFYKKTTLKHFVCCNCNTFTVSPQINKIFDILKMNSMWVDATIMWQIWRRLNEQFKESVSEQCIWRNKSNVIDINITVPT